jgi:hypothetical protein
MRWPLYQIFQPIFPLKDTQMINLSAISPKLTMALQTLLGLFNRVLHLRKIHNLINFTPNIKIKWEMLAYKACIIITNSNKNPKRLRKSKDKLKQLNKLESKKWLSKCKTKNNRNKLRINKKIKKTVVLPRFCIL